MECVFTGVAAEKFTHLVALVAVVTVIWRLTGKGELVKGVFNLLHHIRRKCSHNVHGIRHLAPTELGMPIVLSLRVALV